MRRPWFQAFLLFLVAVLACGPGQNEGVSRKRLTPREGVRRALLKLQAGYNHRNLEAIYSVFSGGALRLIRKTLTQDNLRQVIKGRFFLEDFKLVNIVKGAKKGPVGVRYVFRNELPSGRVLRRRDKALFAPGPTASHWVIISISPR